jgi:hypothetical protein
MSADNIVNLEPDFCLLVIGVVRTPVPGIDGRLGKSESRLGKVSHYGCCYLSVFRLVERILLKLSSGGSELGRTCVCLDVRWAGYFYPPSTFGHGPEEYPRPTP